MNHNPLQQYIRGRMAELGIETYAELGRRSGLSSQTVQQILTQPRRGQTHPKTLKALSQGLASEDSPSAEQLRNLQRASRNAQGLIYGEEAQPRIETERMIGGRMRKIITNLERLDEDQLEVIEAVMDQFPERTRQPA